MKRIFTLIILLAMAASSAHAQKGLHVGVHGQGYLNFIVNQNNYGRTEYEYAPTYNFAKGLSLGYNFDNHIGIQSEILHGYLGQKYEMPRMDQPALKRDVTLEYYHVPVLFKFSGGGDYATRFYIMMGPQFDFLASAKESYESNDESPSYSKLNTTSRYQKKDMSLVMDLGSDFNVYKRMYMNVGLRLNYGLNDINAAGWRMNNKSGMYDASHNAWGGLHFGLNYMLVQ